MKTKNGKAAGSSGIVAKMLKGPSDTGVRLLADFANNMIRNGTIPSDCENSFIISTYQGKGDALIRDKYRGLKHLDHVMKVIERVMEKIIREICSLASCRDGAQLMKYSSWDSQKQLPRGNFRKTCSGNMQQIYRRTPMPKCDFNIVPLQLYWNHTSA